MRQRDKITMDPVDAWHERTRSIIQMMIVDRAPSAEMMMKQPVRMEESDSRTHGETKLNVPPMFLHEEKEAFVQ